MIRQIEVCIGDGQINGLASVYAYKTFLEKRFAYNDNLKSFLCSSALFVTRNVENDEMDLASHKFLKHNDKERNLANNVGREVKLGNKLHLDIFWQDKLLLGGSNLKMRITLNELKFYLLYSNKITPRIKITDCYLKIFKAKLYPSIVTVHQKALGIAFAKYPFVYAPVKTFLVQKGFYVASVDNVHNGTFPRNIIIGMVSHEAVNGVNSKNPYNFQHYNASNIKVFADGIQYEYVTNFAKGHFMESLRGLHQSTKQNETVVRRDENHCWAQYNLYYAKQWFSIKKETIF